MPGVDIKRVTATPSAHPPTRPRPGQLMRRHALSICGADGRANGGRGNGLKGSILSCLPPRLPDKRARSPRTHTDRHGGICVPLPPPASPHHSLNVHKRAATLCRSHARRTPSRLTHTQTHRQTQLLPTKFPRMVRMSQRGRGGSDVFIRQNLPEPRCITPPVM